MAANAGGIGSIDQVAVVVCDLDRAMEHYTNDLGIGPWAVHTFSPDWIKGMTFRGKEQGYTMKLALAQLGPVMYELIEPVEGPTSYHEFLDEHGEGLHHLGYFVEDIDAEIRTWSPKASRSSRAGAASARTVPAPTPISIPSAPSAASWRLSNFPRGESWPTRSGPTRNRASSGIVSR
jgi:hypothetical protein